MTQDEIEEKLIEVVCHIQRLSGREVTAVTGDTKPVLDMPGFDSLNGVEATIELQDQIGMELRFNNVFVDEKKGKALTVRQAGARIAACLRSREHEER